MLRLERGMMPPICWCHSEAFVDVAFFRESATAIAMTCEKQPSGIFNSFIIQKCVEKACVDVVLVPNEIFLGTEPKFVAFVTTRRDHLLWNFCSGADFCKLKDFFRHRGKLPAQGTNVSAPVDWSFPPCSGQAETDFLRTEASTCRPAQLGPVS